MLRFTLLLICCVVAISAHGSRGRRGPGGRGRGGRRGSFGTYFEGRREQREQLRTALMNPGPDCTSDTCSSQCAVAFCIKERLAAQGSDNVEPTRDEKRSALEHCRGKNPCEGKADRERRQCVRTTMDNCIACLKGAKCIPDTADAEE